MKPVHVHCAILAGIILPLGIGGCHVNIGSWGQAQYARTWTGQTPKDALTGLSVKTSSGSITVSGGDVTSFDVTAEIVGRASSEEEAAELTEQVEIVCKPNGDTLEIEAQYPKPGLNQSISVSYTVLAPRQMNVRCESSYGRLSFADLDGTVAGKTSSGSVEARRIKGSIDLQSSYGAVTCADVHSPGVVLRTSSGSVHATNITGSLRAGSSYGSVTCKGFSSGDLSLKSSSGRVTLSDATFGTCEAESSYGSVSADRAAGKAMKLHSGSGSISAADSRTDQMDLSTSYGSVNAGNVTTTNLTARSSSGSVNCELSPDAPPSLTADVSSSYGSVSLSVPPGFAGQVELSTDYGSIHTELPVTTSGEISRKRLTGSIGAGPGRLRLHTSSGSVSLK